MSYASHAQSKRRRLGRASIAGLAAVSLVTGGAFASMNVATAATPQNKIDTVKNGDGSWVEQAYECTDSGADLTPQQESVAGPQRAPFGSGSHHITINEYSTQTELYRTPKYDGQPLASLDRLGYSTHAGPKQAGDPVRQPTYMRLTVDRDGNQTPDDSLFFIPANNGDQQAVKDGTWQNWDVGHGKLSVNGDSGPENTVTLDQYVQQHPNATLINNHEGMSDGGSIALVTGCGQGGNTDPQRNGDYYVDRVIVGDSGADTLYDFEGPSETQGDTTKQTVDPSNRMPWVSQAYDYQSGNDLTSNQKFVEGPGQAPDGRGSLRFTVSDDTNPNRIEQFRTEKLDGRLLRDVRDLSFSTYTKAMAGNGTPQQPPYLHVKVDNNGDGGVDDVLFFYPANNADQQPVAGDRWQSWDAAAGKWNSNGDDGPQGAFTLDQYLAEHPDATIVNSNPDDTSSWSNGGVTFQVGAGGSGQTNGDYFVDDVTMTTADKETSKTVSGTEYNLEPSPAAPAAPKLSIDDQSVAEGNAGTTTNEKFTVSMDKAADKAVTVDYATENGSATAPGDYTESKGTATIPAGQKSTTVNVPVKGDADAESDETFTTTLSNPQNADIADASGTGTITDDDTTAPPSSGSISINDARLKEGNSSTAPETFTIKMDQPSNGPTTVDYNTANGVAKSTSDFTPKAGTATIADGQTTATVKVPVTGDKAFEPNESYTVHLANAVGNGNPEITDPDGTGTIVNDDTKVTTNAANATGTHVRVGVNTTPNSANKPVRIFQSDPGADTVLWSGKLDANGHVSKVPAKQFHKGSTVKIYSVVSTSNGGYASSVDKVTIN